MDLKTLEYMEERTKNARKLVNRIEKLVKEVEKIRIADKVMFCTNNTSGNYVELTSSYELIQEIRKSTIEAITKEITRLEKELAEL
ncbi:hypothetical protein M3175_01355 [Robertmurraya korlensis]|uniref:hypothetical protein n=1 Tax=Robertmurraya korlensis TaxID=519977 RepID=UPI0020410000|nr:hypothetical protein [Robertmurraya korlensis]MCM3599361.1 hypothetical protein [Robertmurraya korlensis]